MKKDLVERLLNIKVQKVIGGRKFHQYIHIGKQLGRGGGYGGVGGATGGCRLCSNFL